MKRNLLQSIMFFWASLILFGQPQNALFDHITIEDGLSHSLINRITQDSTGYIWVATQEGLNRFDGYSIKAFKKGEYASNFTDNWITCLTTDKYGNVWYGTRAKGFGKYEESTNKFTNYEKVIRERFGELGCKIQDILIDSDTCFWISTWGGGLLKFNPVTEHFKQYLNIPNETNSLSENRIYSAFKDSKGDLWIGTHRTGLNKFDLKRGEFKNYRVQENFANGLTNNFVVTVEEDFTGKLWIGTYGGGAYCFDDKNEYFSKICSNTKISDTLITKIFEDSENILWICTDGGGVYRYNREKDIYDNFKNIPSNTRSLNDNEIWSVMEDNAGILWFGSFSGGINIYNKNKNIFQHHYHIEHDPNSIADNFVKSLFQDSRGNIWIGTNNGLSIVNTKTKAIKNYSTENGLPHNRIRKIYEDLDGLIWLATWGGGIIKFNPANQKFSSIINNPDDPNSLADNYVKAIIQHPNGKFYIGTEVGLNEFDPVNNSYKIYRHDENDSTSISNPQVSVLFIDSKNRFWVGTQDGLNLFNLSNGTFKRYIADSTNNSLNNYRVSEIYEDKKGRLWIGTYGGGLNLFNEESQTFSYITEEDGLSNNSIYEILEDDNGYFWVSTNRGLTSFNYEKMDFRIFTKQDGLQENEFNGGAALKAYDGRFYFGGVNGITSFYPNDVVKNSRPPAIVLTKFIVNETQRELNGLSSNPDEFNLNYDENFLRFEFAALDFTAPKLNRYRYKLIGLEDEWIESGNNRFVTYTNLDPGSYSLRVIASNNDGIWNTEGMTINFNIIPPWYGTILFRLLMVAFIIFVLIAIYRLRLNQVKLHQKKLEELVKQRTAELEKHKEQLQLAVTTKDKLFSIVAHDLKNPFLPLLGYSEMLAEQSDQLNESEMKNSARLVHESARSIYSLLENLLDWARVQLKKFEFYPRDIKLHNLVNEIFGLYHVIANYKGIQLKNEVEPSSNLFTDIDMLKTILRNLVSNSVKYCVQGDSIVISCKEVEGSSIISITDSGSGIDTAILTQLNNSLSGGTKSESKDKSSGTGLGLVLVKDLLKIMKGSYEINSEKGRGTEIIIEIPTLLS